MAFDSNYIKTLECYTTMKNKTTKTQLDYYIENNSPIEILDFVKLSNKAFGSEIEKLTKEIFQLKKSKHSSYDLSFKKYKFEVKGSRKWGGKTFKWQHIMEEHHYHFIILCGIDYQELKFWIISKTKFLELKNENIVSQQGGGEGQGLWCDFEKIKEHLIPLKNKNDFNNYLNNFEQN
jgi:hypothetical protein